LHNFTQIRDAFCDASDNLTIVLIGGFYFRFLS
jgi:hypothetical protein